jgi:hypothetical protein
MRRALVLAAVILGAAWAAAGAGATTECAGLPTCIDVPGPWVAVPARGEASFLLECPQRRGIVGGVDSLASSRDVRVTFDGLLGGPVAPGRTTTRYAFFHALSARHQDGLFQPRIGCIPSSSGQRATTSARITPPGPPVDLAAATLPVAPGTVRHTTIGCVNGSRYVDSWDAVAFTASSPPPAVFAEAVHVQRVVRKGQVAVTISVSEGLARKAGAEVQVGVICSR